MAAKSLSYDLTTKTVTLEFNTADDAEIAYDICRNVFRPINWVMRLANPFATAVDPHPEENLGAGAPISNKPSTSPVIPTPLSEDWVCKELKHAKLGLK
jgi:hypothetical protein